MKLKQTPADFRVEELTDLTPGASGEFALYQLAKTGWTTPDAVRLVRERWRIDPRCVAFGGLKDRHAETTQHVTIYRGPRRDLRQDRIHVRYLGQVAEPFASHHIRANRFAVTLRGLTADAEQSAARAAEAVARTGVPNYFDDQRFGSVGPGSTFVAKEMVLGRFEEALKLALVAPYEFDRADAKREKDVLRKHWGDWPACRAALPRGHVRDLVMHLAANPTDFRGAVARLRPELSGLYLSAYQSFLWNWMLARWLAANFPADALGRVALKTGEYPVPLDVPEALAARWDALSLPLPSARLKPDPTAEWHPLVESVLADEGEGLTLPGLKVPGLHKPFFSKGDRAGCVRPTGLTCEPADDDLNAGRRKLTLRFDLPRGGYATMLVKRVTAVTSP